MQGDGDQPPSPEAVHFHARIGHDIGCQGGKPAAPLEELTILGQLQLPVVTEGQRRQLRQAGERHALPVAAVLGRSAADGPQGGPA
jgi:hypothetical protein